MANTFPAFTAFPATAGTVGPTRYLDDAANGGSVRVLLSGASFTVRVQISNAQPSSGPAHLFIPPDGSFETAATVTAPDAPLTLSGPARWCRVIVDAGQVDGGTISDTATREGSSEGLEKLAAQLGASVTGKTQDQLAADITSAITGAIARPGEISLQTKFTPRVPFMVLTFDDGRVEDMTVVKPQLDSRNIKGVFAINPGVMRTGGWADYQALSAAGHEIASHSLTHLDMTTLSETALDNDMRTSRDLIRAKGIPCDAWIAPASKTNALIRRYIRKYYRGGMSAGGLNLPPIWQTVTQRQTIIPPRTYVDNYKQWVDDCVAQNGLLITIAHPGLDFDATQQGYFWQMVDYAISQGVTIGTYQEALDRFGNLIDSGDLPGGASYFVVDRDGKASIPASGTGPVQIAPTINKALDGTTFINNDTPPSFFPNGVISFYAISAATTNLPAFVTASGTTALAGTLEVQRVRAALSSDTFTAYDRQTFREYSTDKIWVRRANGQSAWSAWSQVGGSGTATAQSFVISDAINKYPGTTTNALAADLITAWPNNQETVVFVNTTVAHLFPTTVGTVRTRRASRQGTGFYQGERQYFEEYGTLKRWVRKPLADDNWGAWDTVALASDLPGADISTSLRTWAESGAMEQTARTLDGNGICTTATVKWPDGSGGTLTYTNYNSTWLLYDGYTVTHTVSGKTVTQAAVTRSTLGGITVKPALTVA